MKILTNKSWWDAALVRALRTFFQTLVAMIGTSVVFTDVDWIMVLSAAGLAALLSLAQSLSGLPEVPTDTPTDTPVE